MIVGGMLRGPVAQALASAAALTVTFAQIQPSAAQDFFKDKTITLSIGSGVGGGFDIYGRTVAQFLGKHIPGNPTIKPVNRPGAGGRASANLLFAVDPKDGTYIGLLGPWLVTEPLFGVQGPEFDPTRLNWLMSPARDVSACMFWKRSGITTFADLRSKEVTVGASGPTAITATDAYVLNAIFGARIKIILGFKGTAETIMAAERGELDGSCGMWISTVTSRYMRPLENGDAAMVVQLGMVRHRMFPKVPHILDDLNPSADDRAAIKLLYAQLDMARPFAAPPGVPEDRVAMLRAAFERLVKDREFLAEAEKRALEVEPVPGARIQELIAEMYATPKPIVERAKKMSGY